MFDMMTSEDLGREDSDHPEAELQLAAVLEPSGLDESGLETIPAGLDEMEPGVFLAAILKHTDIDCLNPHDRVVVLRAQQWMASHHQARAYAAMAAITAAREQDPDELAGFGSVIADIARQVAEHQTCSQWRYTVTDPHSGALLDAGTTRRRPGAAQRRWVEARDRTCVFPGCRAPATGSDLDHTTPHAHDGRTATWNLGPLCRHHHNLKTNHGWTYRRHPSGDHIWRSQLGHTYTTSGRSP